MADSTAGKKDLIWPHRLYPALGDKLYQKSERAREGGPVRKAGKG